MTESVEHPEVPRFDGTGVLAHAAELLAGFDATSVMALLYAACSGPTARQAMASCAALLMSAWVTPPAGSRAAAVEDLAPLVEALRAVCPNLAMVEDFLPLDPRNHVRFRATSGHRSWDFRVHPGGLESPLQVLDGVVSYAEALDPVLVPRLGFGVADVLHIAGQMLEAELSVMAPAWGDQHVEQESLPIVTETEVAAAASYLERWQSDEVSLAALFRPAGDDDSERYARAVRTLTIESDRLSFDAGPDRTHVGPALFVQGPAGVLPVPSALIVESLTAAVMTALRFLAAHSQVPAEGSRGASSAAARGIAAEEVAEAGRRWRSRADSDLAWACRAVPATILFGYVADDGHELLLIGPGHRHVVAVDLVTGLTSQEIAEGVRQARERLAAFEPGSLFRVSPQSHDVTEGPVPGRGVPPEGTTDSSFAWFTGTADAIPFAESLMTGEAVVLAAGTVVTRLVVVAGPWQHGPRWIPEIPACTLDEFRSLLATQDWQSTDREELWSFLDELAGLGADDVGGGCAELFCWSILDAWDAWLVKGMLCPAWADPGTCVFIPPRDLDVAWIRDAPLDDVDALLISLGMGGVRGWLQLVPTPVPAAEPGSDEWSLVVTLSIYQPRRTWWVAADMGLLVTADLEFRDGLTFSRAAVGTLANTIEDTLREVARRSPEAWQLWRQAHGGHPIAILVTPQQLPEHMPPLRFIGLRAQSDQLLADPKRLAGLPSADVHALIGEALTFSMLARRQPIPEHAEPGGEPDQDDAHAEEQAARADSHGGDTGSGRVMELSPSDEDIKDAEVFTAAWQSISPRLAQRANQTPFMPYTLTSAQTLTEGGQNRAKRTIARRLRTQLEPGTYPLRLVLAELCPGALEALSDATCGYAPRAALAAACAELERALSDRFAASLSLELNLGSPWADDALTELDIGASSDDTHRTRVAELLIERILIRPPAGSLVPDRRDIHHLLDLASAAFEASHQAQDAFAAIHPAELIVSGFGDIDITPSAPPKTDVRAWQQAQLENQARAVSSRPSQLPGPEDPPETAGPADSGDAGPMRRQTFRSLLEEEIRNGSGFQPLNASGLLRVDDQLREHCGFEIDSALAVLATVASWGVPAEPHPSIAQVSRAALVDDITAWSGLPREQINAAIAACTLTAEHIRQEGLRYWQLRERSARLALRPLIEPPDAQDGDELWLLPRCAHRTQHLLLNYLNDQQLPWPDRDLPKPVKRAVKAWHKIAEDYLESQLAATARSAGLACRANLTEQKASREGLTLHGEIDLLAADPTSRRIWVIEAKHLRRAISPLEIGFHLADFHGASALATGPDTNEFRQLQSHSFRPYVQRVTANARAIELNKQAAIRLISAVSPESNLTENTVNDWQVIPLMVTSHVEVAAFVPEPAIPFVLIDHLQELLTADTYPSPGWWSPWAC